MMPCTITHAPGVNVLAGGLVAFVPAAPAHGPEVLALPHQVWEHFCRPMVGTQGQVTPVGTHVVASAANKHVAQCNICAQK